MFKPRRVGFDDDVVRYSYDAGSVVSVNAGGHTSLSAGVDMNNTVLPPVVHKRIAFVSGDVRATDYNMFRRLSPLTLKGSLPYRDRPSCCWGTNWNRHSSKVTLLILYPNSFWAEFRPLRPGNIRGKRSGGPLKLPPPELTLSSPRPVLTPYWVQYIPPPRPQA